MICDVLICIVNIHYTGVCEKYGDDCREFVESIAENVSRLDSIMRRHSIREIFYGEMELEVLGADANNGVLERETLYKEKILEMYIDGRLEKHIDKLGDIITNILSKYFEYEPREDVYKLRLRKTVARKIYNRKIVPVPEQVINGIAKYLSRNGYEIVYCFGRKYTRRYFFSKELVNIMNLVVTDGSRFYGFIYVTVGNKDKVVANIRRVKQKFNKIYLICYRDVCEEIKNRIERMNIENIYIVNAEKLEINIKFGIFNLKDLGMDKSCITV